MMDMKINFLQKGSGKERTMFFAAVLYEEADMEICLLDRKIKMLEKRLDNADLLVEEIMEIEAELEELNAERIRLVKIQLSSAGITIIGNEEDEVQIPTLKDCHKIVINFMTVKNADHFGNSKDAVRNVLRTLATTLNPKVSKLALISPLDIPKLAEALHKIHVTQEVDETGASTDPEAMKAMYVQARAELENVIKTTYSLPFATAFTKKLRIKLNGEDLRLLHECYVRGFKNDFEVTEDEVISFKGRNIQTLVKSKTTKKGAVKMNYTALGETITKIVIGKYFA